VKALTTYQQLFLYFVPLLTNVGFVSAFPVAARLFWFKRQLKESFAQTGSAAVRDVEKSGSLKQEDEFDAEKVAVKNR
jgi:hypothetical protein